MWNLFGCLLSAEFEKIRLMQRTNMEVSQPAPWGQVIPAVAAEDLPVPAPIQIGSLQLLLIADSGVLHCFTPLVRGQQ